MTSSSSKMVGMMPPPPGQVANFVDAPTQTNANIALYTIMLTACGACLAVRMYTRLALNHQFGFDDVFCIAAFLFLIAYSALMLVCGNYYAGHHMWDITIPNFIYGAKLETWAEWCYLVVTGTVKLSYLLLYIRIFGPFQRITAVLWTGVVAVALIYVVLLMMSILECEPIEFRWNPTIEGHCLPSGVLAYSSGAFNVATDLFVLLVPMPTVWSMNLDLTRKLRVSAVFSLGLIAVAMSITRLAKTPLVFKSTDPSWDLSSFAIFSILELSFGFICCCLLTFPAFLEYHGSSLMIWIRSYGSSSGGKTNSKGTSQPGSEKVKKGLRADENDHNSFGSYNSADARLTFASVPTGFPQGDELEPGELRQLSSSRSRLEQLDIEQ